MYRSHHLGLGLPSFGVTAILAVAFVLAGLTPAAAESTWTGLAFAGAWNNANNWSPSGVPDSPAAVVNFTGNQIGTVNISLSVNAQSLDFSNPTGNYMLTSSAGQSLGSVSSITVDAAVTGLETINLANISSGSLLFPTGNDLTITNNSTAAGTALVIGPNTVIGTPGFGGVIVTGAGTTQISGSFAASPFAVDGGLVKNGTGTLILSHAIPETYTGGTFINGGILALGAGNEIPSGSDVTINGGQFNIGSHSNSATTAIGTLSVSPAGTFLVPSGAGDYHLNQLVMTGGTVDFSGTSAFYLHLHQIGITYAAITTIASSTTATWLGSANSHIQNDTAGPLTITVNQGTTSSGIDLDAGIALANGSMGQGFVKAGPGTMRLTNTANTANFIINQGALLVDDMAALGTGTVATGGVGGVLQYGGPTATSTKNINLGTGATGTIQVLTDGVNLTLNGVITGVNQNLAVVGAFTNGTSSKLTLNNVNTYTGSTTVDGNVVLAIPYIETGGYPSSIGSSSSAAANLVLGSTGYRGTLLYTGNLPVNVTDRDATLIGAYPAGGAIGVEDANNYLTWEGRFTGTGNLIKTGAGTLFLDNAASTYFAGTYIEAGTLVVDGSGAVIPANTNVTVFSGATFKISYRTDNEGVPIGTLALNGGTLSLDGNPSRYYLNKLAMTGGVVDLSQANIDEFDLHFTGTGAAITINASSTTATWIGGVGARAAIEDNSLGPLPINVAAGTTANGIDLDAGISLSIFGNNPAFIKAGAGTMRLTSLFNHADFIVQKGALRVDDLTNGVGALGTGKVTLNGGRLAYGGSDATLSKPFTVDTSGGTIDVLSAATTLTVTSLIVTNGVLTKSGPGVLVLNNLTNLYDSGLVVSGGRLDVDDDAQLGLASPTVNPAGTLRYTADTSTARAFTMFNGSMEVPSGVTLTLDGAAIGGGYLRGAGTFALTGGTALSSVATLTSTTVNQTGPATVTNFTSGGAFTVDAGQTLAWNGGTNTSSGRLTVNGAADVSDFVSNGLVTLNPGAMLSNTGSDMVLGGGSRTTINPSATLTTAVGTSIELNGGLLVNNGTISGTTDVNYGSLAKGTGTYGLVNVNQGGVYAPGNSPGIVTAAAVNFDSTPVTSGAPTLQIELSGTTPGVQYDQLHVTGQLSLGGTLQVLLVPGFTPSRLNKFDILDWGTRSGTFSSLQLPALTGTLGWNISNLYSTGTLSVIDLTKLPGDLDHNGLITSDDFPLLMMALTDPAGYTLLTGVSAADLAILGDADESGTVDNGDMQALLYEIIHGTNFVAGSAPPLSVPEPASISLLLTGTIACLVITGTARRAPASFRNMLKYTQQLTKSSWCVS